MLKNGKHRYKEEITKFLTCLTHADLFTLANTVSQGLLKHKIQDSDGAIGTILKYSPDILSILRRKSITKEILFNYLDDKNVTVTLPTTKDALIDKILKFWCKIDSTKNQSDAEVVPVIKNVCNIYVTSEQNNENCENPTIELALKFSEWFYAIMNISASIPVEHFYHDAKLKLNLVSDTITDSSMVENNPDQIVELLYDTKLKHGLYFNPNLTEHGVSGKVTRHGLVLVATCGSIHIGNQCVGVFEQLFGLAKDPFAENNWKIKYTELNLRNKSNVTTLPIVEREALERPEIFKILGI